MAPESSSASSSSQDGSTRRDFLAKSSAAVAAGAVTSSFIARQAHAAGSNDEIKIALIGSGGRGTGAMFDAMNADKNLRVVALADAFEFRVKHAAKALKRNFGDRGDVPKERQFVGLQAYKEALATDCDMVILATSPGFRPLHFEAAVNADKHVFMEKPVGTDPAGIRKVLKAGKLASQKNLLVQVGLQRRHETRYKETIARLQDGAIGDILLSRAYWNGGTPWVRPRKPGQSEMEYQVQNWYFFNWLCGDHIVEQHIHNLDVINWLKGGPPVEANGMGGREVRNGRDHGQAFDHFFIEFTYADGSKMYSQCRHMPGTWTQVSEFVHGTKGTADPSGTIFDTKGNTIATASGGGGHYQEHVDLFRDFRAGKRPNEAEYGAMSTMTAIFGRMACYSGQKLRFDECLNSEIDLGIRDFASFEETPPVVPDNDGRYPVPVPGKYKVV